jgi:hypothetical protein
MTASWSSANTTLRATATVALPAAAVEPVVHAIPRANIPAHVALAEASRGDVNITSEQQIRGNSKLRKKDTGT